jgi:PQQ-dependent dehydrogenase (methanol/ethanol family)
MRRINALINRAIILGATAALASGVHAQTPHAQTPDGDWTTFNRTYGGERFSPLKEITTDNVGELRPVCTYDTGETVAFQTGPLVVNGVMYFTTFKNTYAIDAGTCALKWKREIGSDDPAKGKGLRVNRGLGYLNGRLFRGANDGRVYAIDAESGKTLWGVAIADPARGESVPMAPVAWNGTVFVGNAGGDNFAVTGRVYGLDAETGKQVWRFDTVPETGPAAATWPKKSADNPPAGGAMWTTFSLDTSAGVLYVTTGNAAPNFAKQLRPGENLYTTSVVALDAKTGGLLGYIQPTTGDIHDWDMAAAPALITTHAGRKLAATAGKDGLLYGIDRGGLDQSIGGGSQGNGNTSDSKQGAAGQNSLVVRYQTPFTTRYNTSAPLTSERPTRFCPGSQGGAVWNGPAYYPELNLIFVPAVDWCTTVKLVPVETLRGQIGKPWTGALGGGFGQQDPKERWRGWVTAVDADTGRVRWKYQSSAPHLAAVTPTAGGLVFAANLVGEVFAFDARTGRVLWRDRIEPNGGGVVSYSAGGRQRIAFASGMKSPLWPVSSKSSRVVVYGLP